MKIAPIVEGHGELEGVPVLLRRMALAAGVHAEIARPIRISRAKLVKEVELRRAVKLASFRTDPGDAILVLLDADDDCPARFAPQLLAWATAERADRTLAVVLAVSEFEAWFLAAAESLATKGKLPPGTLAPLEPETVRDAKGWLSKRMGRRYSPTTDQPAFAALFDLEAARATPSFDKLVREVERIVRGG